jgi:glycosyltransferase involved in cell wall biosynthesis
MFKAKILFLLTEDWFFCSHFIERALAAQAAGYDVVVVAREREHGAQIRAAGLRFVDLEFERRSTHLLTELRQLRDIILLYRREKPDVVHQVSPKPIFYGTASALLNGVHAIVNAPVGMGYVFSSKDLRARLLGPFVRIAYRLLANPRRSCVVFENSDDLTKFVQWGAVKASDAVLIRGAGVNLSRFRPVAKHNSVPLIALVARMLRDKGIYEFVEAAHQLHLKGIAARFILVGSPDPMNPSSITEETLRKWHGRNGVEWWGWNENIAQLLENVDIMCLPSYREGLPKSLIEAAACAVPIVTTNTPGCREVVRHGDNGFLVPVQNVPLLAESLERLILDQTLRETMGRRGREIAVQEFSSVRIIAETLDVYSRLLS